MDNEKKINISKSKYLRYKFCPKALWRDQNAPHLAKERDERAELAIKAGQEVGKLAHGLFCNTVDATVLNMAGRTDLSASIKKTQELLNNISVDVIAEASFSFEGCFAAVDLLRRTQNGFEIYEVKSSTVLKDRYITDLAYQHYVLAKCGVNIENSFIVLLNNAYARCGELDLQGLFKARNVLDTVNDQEKFEKAISFIEFEIEKTRQTLRGGEPKINIRPACFDCSYGEICLKDVPDNSVFDIHGLGKKGFKYYNEGIVTYKDALLKEVPLNEKQLRQITSYLFDEPMHVDKEGVKEFLNSLWYPLYFLDFETFQPAVPLYEGAKSYQQIPFQYSLHYIEEEHGRLQHKEYLANHAGDPREEIALRLVDDIPKDACVLTYNMLFEKSVLLKLANRYPKLEEHLTKVADNVRDLIDPFEKGHVYDKAMSGSLSLKSVLPALFPDSPEFNYCNLTGVHNGVEAQVAYLKLPNLTKEEQIKKREELLAYCKLDTMAMAMLWIKLRELALE
jgi:hypothetical protein